MPKSNTQEKTKDRIVSAELKLRTQKISSDALKVKRDNEIKKANDVYQITLQKIDQAFEKDMVVVERLRKEKEEKKKKATTEAKIVLDRTLDSIEAKY
ncbi:MAG: hypothetical protein LBD63_02225 [Mycoplasmataceae bacterium]|jgi:3-phosphoglycerate kinase|nr:hypothetical protein [Mycoplasmataceae bacterium]